MRTLVKSVEAKWLNWLLFGLFFSSLFITEIYGWWSKDERLQYIFLFVPLLALLTSSIFRINIIKLGLCLASFFYISLVGVGPFVSVVGLWILAYLIGKKSAPFLEKDAQVIDSSLFPIVGFSFIGLLITILSHFRVNYHFVYLGLYLLTLYCTARNQTLEQLRDISKDINLPNISMANGAIFIALIMYAYMVTVKPDFGHDGLSVHLTIPRFISEFHIWDYNFREFIWSLLPIGAEMLYTPVYMFGGEDGVRLLNTTFLASTGFLIYRFSRLNDFSQNYSLLLSLAFLSTPLGFYVIGSTFVEPVFIYCVTGIFFIGLNSHRSWRALFLILGYACTIRISGIVLAPFMFLAFLGSKFRDKNFKFELLIVIVIFLAFSAINYVNAYLLTGNPVFPLFNHIFKSPFFDLVQNYNQHWINNSNGILNAFLMIFDSKSFGDIDRNGALGILPAILVPIIILLGLRSPTKNGMDFYLTLVGFIFIYFLFSKQAYLRYVFPVLGAFYLVFIKRIASINHIKSLLSIILFISIVINLIKIPYAGTHFPFGQNEIYFDNKLRREFLIKEKPYAVVGEILKSFPQFKGKKILLVGEGYDPVYYYYPKNTVAFSWHSDSTFRSIIKANFDLKEAAKNLNIDLIVCPLKDRDQSAGSDARFQFSKQCREISKPVFVFENVYIGEIITQ